MDQKSDVEDKKSNSLFKMCVIEMLKVKKVTSSALVDCLLLATERIQEGSPYVSKRPAGDASRKNGRSASTAESFVSKDARGMAEGGDVSEDDDVGGGCDEGRSGDMRKSTSLVGEGVGLVSKGGGVGGNVGVHEGGGGDGGSVGSDDVSGGGDMNKGSDVVGESDKPLSDIFGGIKATLNEVGGGKEEEEEEEKEDDVCEEFADVGDVEVHILNKMDAVMNKIESIFDTNDTLETNCLGSLTKSASVNVELLEVILLVSWRLFLLQPSLFLQHLGRIFELCYLQSDPFLRLKAIFFYNLLLKNSKNSENFNDLRSQYSEM